MHGLQVLGIDSSTTNTHSAKTRAKRLEKHWHGLLRNASEDNERGFKVRRGKNYRGKLRKKLTSKSDSGQDPDKSKESIGSVSSVADTEMDVNLESIFKERLEVPAPQSTSLAQSERGRLKSANLDSLVIYMSEPKVRKPRGSSSDNRDDDEGMMANQLSPSPDKEEVFEESRKMNNPSPIYQEKSPSGNENVPLTDTSHKTYECIYIRSRNNVSL